MLLLKYDFLLQLFEYLFHHCVYVCIMSDSKLIYVYIVVLCNHMGAPELYVTVHKKRV